MPLDDDALEKIHEKLPEFVTERKAAARGQAATSDHVERLNEGSPPGA
jgi:hypothetical protein